MDQHQYSLQDRCLVIKNKGKGQRVAGYLVELFAYVINKICMTWDKLNGVDDVKTKDLIL